MPCRFLRFDLGTFIHADLLKIAAFDSDDSGIPCCFAMRLRWPSKQTTRSILVVLHRQCGMPIRRCLCCRRHSIFLLESSRVGQHLPLFRNNSRFCVCLVVSLKVLEVVLGSVCLLLVRPQAIVGYDMSYGQNLVQGEGTSINRVSVWWTGLVGSSQLRRDGKAWLHCKQTAKAACSVWEAHCHAWRTTLSITRQCRSALWAQETNFGWGHRRNIIPWWVIPVIPVIPFSIICARQPSKSLQIWTNSALDLHAVWRPTVQGSRR